PARPRFFFGKTRFAEVDVGIDHSRQEALSIRVDYRLVRVFVEGGFDFGDALAVDPKIAVAAVGESRVRDEHTPDSAAAGLSLPVGVRTDIAVGERRFDGLCDSFGVAFAAGAFDAAHRVGVERNVECGVDGFENVRDRFGVTGEGDARDERPVARDTLGETRNLPLGLQRVRPRTERVGRFAFLHSDAEAFEGGLEVDARTFVAR